LIYNKSASWNRTGSRPRLLLGLRYPGGGGLHDDEVVVVKAVERLVYLPAPRAFGRIRGRIEKLVNGEVEQRYELVEDLQAGVLPLVFDIRQVARVDMDNPGNVVSRHLPFRAGFLDSEAKRPEIV